MLHKDAKELYIQNRHKGTKKQNALRSVMHAKCMIPDRGACGKIHVKSQQEVHLLTILDHYKHSDPSWGGQGLVN